MIPEEQLEAMRADVLAVTYAVGAIQGASTLLASGRAKAVAALVSACDDNQSEAARQLGIDQSTVSRMSSKAGAMSLEHVDLDNLGTNLGHAVNQAVEALARLKAMQPDAFAYRRPNNEMHSLPEATAAMTSAGIAAEQTTEALKEALRKLP